MGTPPSVVLEKSLHAWPELRLHVSRAFLKSEAKLATHILRRDILERIAVQIESDILEPKELCGLSVLPDSAIKPQSFLAEKQTADLPTSFHLSYSLSCFAHPAGGRGQPTIHGAHIKYYRAASFPLQIPDRGAEVRVSTINFLGCNFISRISYHAKENPQTKVGYVTDAGENSLQLPPSRGIKDVEVVFRISGLVGIRFCFTDNTLSAWLGHVSGEDVAYGILRIPRELNAGYWIIGLDNYKIAKLGFAVSKKRALDASPHTLDPPHPSPNSPLSYLWVQKVPKYDDLFVHPIQPSGPPKFAAHNIDFGGPGGEYLGSLTRVVLHMVSNEVPIIGIELFYTDSTLTFGSRGGTELSFIIDGPGGERIVEIEIMTSGPGCDTARGVQFSTNHGRSMRFATMSYASGCPVELRQKLPDQYIITGFAITQEQDKKHIAGLGLLGQPSHNVSHVLSHISDVSLLQNSATNQLEYDKQVAHGIRAKRVGEYRTWASFKAVKRIYASIGLAGRSRSSSRISGLKLEYYDHRGSIIVGQWMNTYDTFELGLGEEICGLMIWLSRDHRSKELPGLVQGQIFAIRIETTFNRSKTFQPPDSGLHAGECQQQQYRASLEEELIGISWILNSSYDRIRGITSSNVLNRPPIYMIHPPAYPRDQVQGIFFFKEDSDTSSMVSSIEVYINYGVICGIAFLYPSERKRWLGDITTAECQSIEVVAGSRINLFLANMNDAGIAGLEFRFVTDGEQGPTQLVKYLGECPSNTPSPYDYRQVWYTYETEGSENFPGMYKYVDVLPRGAELAGLYVSCQDFSYLGALFRYPEA